MHDIKDAIKTFVYEMSKHDFNFNSGQSLSQESV